MATKIKEDLHVVIIDNSKNRKCFQVKKGLKVYHYKVTIDCSQLIGKDYNTFWQVTDQRSG